MNTIELIAVSAAAILGLIMLAGLVAGQFRRGVVGELRDALDTARTEIEVERGRADRLERSVDLMEKRIHELEARPDFTQVVALMHSHESNIVAAVKQSQIDLLRTVPNSTPPVGG